MFTATFVIAVKQRLTSTRQQLSTNCTVLQYTSNASTIQDITFSYQHDFGQADLQFPRGSIPHTTHHTTTVSRPFFRDHLGQPVPEQNFWTLWCPSVSVRVRKTIFQNQN